MTHVKATDAQRAARITYRQLDHWTTNGYIRTKTANPGSGNGRVYTEREVRVLTLMAGLVHAGVEPSVASRVARQIVAKGSSRLGRQFTVRAVA